MAALLLAALLLRVAAVAAASVIAADGTVAPAAGGAGARPPPPIYGRVACGSSRAVPSDGRVARGSPSANPPASPWTTQTAPLFRRPPTSAAAGAKSPTWRPPQDGGGRRQNGHRGRDAARPRGASRLARGGGDAGPRRRHDALAALDDRGQRLVAAIRRAPAGLLVGYEAAGRVWGEGAWIRLGVGTLFWIGKGAGVTLLDLGVWVVWGSRFVVTVADPQTRRVGMSQRPMSDA